MEPGKPLSFLDHHIQVGNSLLGTTPALLANGIPDDAFTPIEGDIKAKCAELKRDNKRERSEFKSGQGYLFDTLGKIDNLAAELAKIDETPDESVEGILEKQRRYVEMVEGEAYQSGRLLADTWCAAFVWKKDGSEIGNLCPTERTFRKVETLAAAGLLSYVRDEVERLRDEYQFFHWHIAFPDVFQICAKPNEGPQEQPGWIGGFDVILGNPPWERVKLQDDEFFAARDEQISSQTNASVRRELVSSLATRNPELFKDYLHAVRNAESVSRFLRNSSRFPYCGRGDVNTYTVFAELATQINSGTGRAGLVVPSGIATDITTSYFFSMLVDTSRLVSLYDFENRERRLFPTVYYRLRFCLITMSGKNAPVQHPDYVFTAYRVEDLTDPNRHFSLTSDDISRLNPDTKTCPMFESRYDADLTLQLYRNYPLLGDGNKDTPQFTYRRIFDMSNDASLFLTAPQSESYGSKKHSTDCFNVPLYEGRMFDAYNHRVASMAVTTENIHRSGVKLETIDSDLANPEFSVTPRYWINNSVLVDRLGTSGNRNAFLAIKDITSATNARTVIASIIPYAATGNTSPVLLCDEGMFQASFLAMLNCFVFDFAARKKVSGNHLTLSVLKQLPTLPESVFKKKASWDSSKTVHEWLTARVIELTFASYDIEAFARQCGYFGPPFVWDQHRRRHLRCEVDAAMFHLFGVSRDHAEYILSTFRIVRERDEESHGEAYTFNKILEIYDALALVVAQNRTTSDAGLEPRNSYVSQLTPSPGPPSTSLPEWLPGSPRPLNWPSHIHPPRGHQ
jgi:hypothetical protein